MKTTLEFAELEQVYEMLAQAIDEVGEANETLLLSKLCITLAHSMPDLEVVVEAIRISRAGILPIENN
jgi:hypothetical protein